MKKKLMILGAGIYQMPLIKRAKNMGLETIVLSIPGDYPGISFADKFYPVDTRDSESVLRLAQQEEIDGICTSGTDIAVRSIGYVNSRMNFSGISKEAAWKATDKVLMKEAFRQGNVSTAAFEKVNSAREAIQAGERIGYPVIVKAVDSSGSRGIRRAEDSTELIQAYQEATSVCKKDYVLVEEYIDAAEIGVDAFMGNGKLEAFYPHVKFNYEIEGRTIPVGHKFPYNASENLMRELEQQITRSANALGMKNCPINADVFVKGEKVWVIEIGGRTGATCIPELISVYGEFDWYENTILAALGEKTRFAGRKRNSCMAKLLFSPVEGYLAKIDWSEIERLNQNGIFCQVDFEPGRKIFAMEDGTDRLGHVLAVTEEESLLDEYVSRVRRCIWLDKGNLEELWEK